MAPYTCTTEFPLAKANHIYRILKDKGVWVLFNKRGKDGAAITVGGGRINEIKEISLLYDNIDVVAEKMNPRQRKEPHRTNRIFNVLGFFWAIFFIALFVVILPWYAWDLAEKLNSSSALLIGLIPSAILVYFDFTNENDRHYKIRARLAAFIENPFTNTKDSKAGYPSVILPIINSGILFGLSLWFLIR